MKAVLLGVCLFILVWNVLVSAVRGVRKSLLRLLTALLQKAHINQILINGSGVINALGNNLFGNLIKGYSASLFIIKTQKLL